MKVVAKTDEYTIYQRRDERYAVKNAERQWVNGDAKVAILLEHKLIDLAAPKPAPEPEAETAEDAGDAPEETAAEADDAQSGEEGAAGGDDETAS